MFLTGIIYSNRSKMQLNKGNDDGNYQLKTETDACLSVCGKKKMSVVDVISGSLKLVKNHVFEKIIDGGLVQSLLDDKEVQWVLKVPAIWPE